MNLVLHHFRKEARYLLPRWWLFVGVLVIELMINLEWILPMTVRGDAWPLYASLVPWGAGLLIAMIAAPEDAAAEAFRSTRPLPALSYWLARVTAFVVMIMLPLVMQEVVYLALSQRPWQAMLAGAGARTLQVASLLGWAAAMSALWRGWRLLVALILSAMLVSFSQSAFAGEGGVGDSIIVKWHPGISVVVIVMLALLIVLKRRSEWSVRRIIIGQAVGCVMIGWLTARWLPATWLDIAANQPRAETLAQQAQFSIRADSLSFWRQTNGKVTGGRFGASLEVHPVEPSYDFMLLPKSSSARAGDQPLATQPSRLSGFIGMPEMFLCDPMALNSKTRALTSHLPAGTILALSSALPYPASGPGVELPALNGPLPELDTPMNFTADCVAHWVDWTPLLELPLQVGASASATDERWSVLDVRFGVDNKGEPSLAAVTMDVRGESSGGIMSAVGASAAFILHSPDRRMIWISNGLEWTPVIRASMSGWTRHLRSLTWQGVLAHADGAPAAVDRSKLKLLVIRPRHLGATYWSWQSPTIKLADLIRPPQFGYSTNEHLHRGEEQAAFDARISSLTKPAANVSRLEVIRYLWDVLSAARGEEFSEQNPPTHLRELLAEVAQYHLDTMLTMPDSMASPWANLLREVLAPFIKEQHKTALLAQLSTQQWLAPIVSERGWITEAVQALAPLLHSTKPLNVHLRKLLIKSDDPAVHRRLLDDFRLHSGEGYEVIDALVKRPELHAELKALADELWKEFSPVLGITQDNRLRLAIQTGNADALAMALRLAAISDDSAGSVHRLVFDLPRLLGLAPPPPKARPADLAPQYRKLKAADFVYRAEKLQWEKKTVVAP